MTALLTMFAGVELPRLHAPADILEHLHHLACRYNLILFSAWRLPHGDLYDPDHYIIDRTVFFNDKGMPAAFKQEFLLAFAANGPSVLGKRAAEQRIGFTHSEVARATQPRGRDRWVFDLHAKHGFRDGLIVPSHEWAVAFASHKIVKLTPRERVDLSYAATQAAARLEAVVKQSKSRAPKLSLREIAVLERLSRGRTTREAAEDLEVSPGTIHKFVERAKKKLGANTMTQAVATAIRRKLI